MAAQYDDVNFPDTIAYGSSGGPRYSTDFVRLPNGHEQRVSRWSSPLNEYNVTPGIDSHKALTELRNFFMARKGGLSAFRFKDYHDCNSTDEGVDESLAQQGYDYGTISDLDQTMLAVAGSTTQFQLVKTYGDDAGAQTKAIIAPVVDTIVVAEDGVSSTSGWTVNGSGVVTFSSAPTNPTWGGEFDHVTRFGPGADRLFSIGIDTFGSASTSDAITLEEVRDDVLVPTYAGGGGSREYLIDANYTITLGDGMFQLINADDTGLVVSLPDPEFIPTGRGPTIASAVGGNTFTLKDNDGNTLSALAAGESIETMIHVDGAGTNMWYAMGIA